MAGDMGCYLLFLRLGGPCRLRVGRRPVALGPGVYAYAGSAQRGLAARIARHLKPARAKRPRWHIDHLLARSDVEAVLLYPLSRPGECWLADRVSREPGASLAALGFGSSDCRCPGHLLRLHELPDLEALRGMSLPEELRLEEGLGPRASGEA